LEGAKRVVRKLALDHAETHAVMFYGAQGSGKEELARILAQFWLCRSPGPDGADGECQACGAFGRGTNPDYLCVTPLGPSALITIRHFHTRPPEKEDDPRPLIPFFRTGPIMSRHKVAIITDAHRMNNDASNALLKTLEEPLPHAKLILTTDSVGSVRPTILSRCLAVPCALPNVDQLRTGFPATTEVDLVLSEGSPGRLKSVLEHAEAYRPIEAFERSIRARNRAAALLASDEFRSLADRLSDARGIPARAANAECLEMLAIALANDPCAPNGWAQAVIEAHQRILGNASATIVFDALFSRILPD
jgi:DNA polymerase-3 subunit delta'